MKHPEGTGSGKRERLVDAALKLMLRRGYWGTTVEDICASADASKGSVFHHFANKEQLALEALDSFVNGIIEHFRGIAAASTASGAERLMVLCDAMIDLAKVQSAANGCLLATISMETNINEGALAERCAQYFEIWCAMLEEQFEQAIAEHGRPVPATAAQLAQFCVSLFEGSLILARARRDVTIVENALHQFKWYVGGLLGLAAPTQAGTSSGVGGQWQPRK
jgi:TetR/AcrR family transcriptional regulator, transcriptional repressor for nem operon